MKAPLQTVRARPAGVAAIACALALATGCGSGGGEQPRALPQVTGLTLAAAERALERANVSWTLSDAEGPAATTFDTARESSGGVNTSLANRRVVAQDPQPGYKAVRGDVVLLTLRR